MKRTKLMLAIAIAVLLSVCACAIPAVRLPDGAAAPAAAQEASAQASAPASEAAVTLTDMKGRTVTLTAPAERIVVLSPGDCEILYAIGAGDLIVGRGEYCDYPSAAADVPSVQTGSETNIEQILAFAPDVVVLNTMAQTLEQVNALENAGIATAASEATDIAGVYAAIDMLGKLTGHGDGADALIGSMRATFETLTGQAGAAGGNGGKTVYFEVSPLVYGLWTAGGGTFMNEIAEKLCLKNAFADVSGWAEISEEQVLARDPDYIVTITAYTGEGPTPEQEIMQRPGWEGVTAVQTGAVIAVDSNAMARPGPRLAEAAAELFQAVYGADAALAPAA